MIKKHYICNKKTTMKNYDEIKDYIIEYSVHKKSAVVIFAGADNFEELPNHDDLERLLKINLEEAKQIYCEQIKNNAKSFDPDFVKYYLTDLGFDGEITTRPLQVEIVDFDYEKFKNENN